MFPRLWLYVSVIPPPSRSMQLHPLLTQQEYHPRLLLLHLLVATIWFQRLAALSLVALMVKRLLRTSMRLACRQQCHHKVRNAAV